MVGGVTMSVLGDRLRKLREARGWSQRYVASKINIKQSSTYANWEYGIRDPDTETLSKLADLFEVQTDYLLGREVMEQLNDDKTVLILRDIVDKLNLNIEDDKEKEKLETIIKLVYGDMNEK